MTVQQYNEMTSWFRKRSSRIQGLKVVNLLITGITYITYIVMIIVLLWQKDIRIIRIVLTTGISFILVSLFRTYISCKRPYEMLDIIPLVAKDKKGKSFPSRHVFSAFVIAMSLFYLNVYIGIIFFAAGFVLAMVRVIAGIHFPRDVIVGAILGIVAGYMGLYIL